jgi:hypothetical protein
MCDRDPLPHWSFGHVTLLAWIFHKQEHRTF